MAESDDRGAATGAACEPPAGAVETGAPTRVARDGDVEWLLAWDDGSPFPESAEGAERYELRGELARGGLGRIHFGWDRRLGRAVAIKEPLTAGARARFYREALLTARLQHPGIVPIYDAGNGPDGAPYYAMRLLSQGRSFSDALTAASSLDERLTLLPHLIAAADAVAYAHGQRIIHRDLKPDNILLGPFGETVVIDWGLAKDLNQAEPSLDEAGAAAEAAGDAAPPAAAVPVAAVPAAGAAGAPPSGSSPEVSRASSRLTPLTLVGTTVGTPAYMSPEQIFQGVVDERTDVYSLGAVLLELLAGKRPALGSAEELRRRLPAGVPADLVAIAGKAVALDPADRYRTARELAADLWRFAAGQLVKAHVYSPVELARRWLSRHRWPVGIAAAALLLLAMLGAAGLRGVIHQRNLAEAARERAEANHDALVLVQARTSLERDPTAALAWLKTYRPEGGQQDLVRSLAADAAARGIARHALPFGDRVRAVDFARGGELLVAADYARTLRLFGTREGNLLGEWERPGGTTHLAVLEDAAAPAPAPAPDAAAAPGAGLRVLTGGVDGRLLLFDLGSGAVTAFAGHSAAITAMRVLSDGNTVVSAARDGSVWRWDLAAGSGRQLTRHRGRAGELAISADERWAISAGVDRQLHLVDLVGGDAPRIFDSGHEVAALALAAAPGAVSPGASHLLAAAGDDHRVRLWRLEGGFAELALGAPRVLAEHGGIVASLAFSPDGALLASASRDRTVRLTAVAGAAAAAGGTRVFTGHTDDIETLLFSPDGSQLVSAGLDGAIRLVDLESGRQRALAGTRLMVERLVFSPDGHWLAAGTQDQDVRVWPTHDEKETVLAGHGNDVDALLFLPAAAPGSPAGLPETLVSAGHDRSLRVWRRQGEGWRAAAALEGHQQPVEFLAALPGGRHVVSGSADQTLRIWDLESGESSLLAGHGNAITGLAVADGGRSLVSSSLDGTLKVWSLAADGDGVLRGELRHTLAGHRGAVQGLALSPDERWLASGGADRRVLLWDWRGGQLAGALEGHDDQVAVLAFSPDGRSLATGAWNGGLRLWQGEGFRAGRELPGHTERVRGLVFAPDGKTLASSSIDHTIRLWEVASPGAVRVLRGHEASVRHLAFSPDGSLLSSSSTDRTARLWDVRSGELVALRRYEGIVTYSAFSPDGSLLAVGGWDKLVHVYPLRPAERIPLGPGSTRAFIDGLTTTSTDRDGKIATRSARF